MRSTGTTTVMKEARHARAAEPVSRRASNPAGTAADAITNALNACNAGRSGPGFTAMTGARSSGYNWLTLATSSPWTRGSGEWSRTTLSASRSYRSSSVITNQSRTRLVRLASTAPSTSQTTTGPARPTTSRSLSFVSHSFEQRASLHGPQSPSLPSLLPRVNGGRGTCPCSKPYVSYSLRSLRSSPSRLRPCTQLSECRSVSSTIRRFAGRRRATRTCSSPTSTGASVIHTTATWAALAPTRPADPTNGDDPAYKLTDLDDLVFQSSSHNLRVMINITGTPKWANGGKAPNVMPKKLGDLTTFARMLATRYNGRSGHGSVSLWSIWNEPNLQLFLTPQFVGKKIVRPGELREALQGGLRRHQVGQPDGARSRSARPRPAAATSRSRASARASRRARSRGCSPR